MYSFRSKIGLPARGNLLKKIGNRRVLPKPGRGPRKESVQDDSYYRNADGDRVAPSAADDFHVSSSNPFLKMGRITTVDQWHEDYVTPSGAGAHQPKFDKLIEYIVLNVLPPSASGATTVELFAALKKCEPKFDPRNFGAFEFLPLLRECKYLTFHNSRWEFTRQNIDGGRQRLTPYRHQTSPSQDGVRTVPNLNADLRWT